MGRGGYNLIYIQGCGRRVKPKRSEASPFFLFVAYIDVIKPTNVCSLQKLSTEWETLLLERNEGLVSSKART